jgi:hypothetical protein
MEHQVRFAKLHEKRAEVIAALDGRLCELEILGQRYVEGVGQGREEAYAQWKDKWIECNSFLNSRQIYLNI